MRNDNRRDFKKANELDRGRIFFNRSGGRDNCGELGDNQEFGGHNFGSLARVMNFTDITLDRSPELRTSRT